MAFEVGSIRVVLTADTANALRGIRTFQQSLSTLVTTAQARLKQLDSRLSSISLSIAAGLGAATTRAAIQFDQAMTNVRSITKSTSAEFTALRREILRTANDLGVGASAAASGLLDIVGSGFDAAEAVDILSASLRGAKAGMIDTTLSTRLLVGVLNSFRIDASQSDVVMSKLLATVDRGVVTFEELGKELGTVAPIAAALGISLDDMLAILAAGTRRGVAFNEVVTQLSSLLASLISPGSDAADELERILDGISFEGSVKSIGLVATLKKIVEAAGGSATALSKIITDIRGLRLGAILLGEGIAEVGTDLDAIRAASENLTRVYDIQSVSLRNLLLSMKAAISNAFVEVIENNRAAITRLLLEVTEWISHNQELIVSLASIGTALAAAAAGLLAFKVAVTGLNVILGLVGGSLRLVGALLKLDIAASATKAALAYTTFVAAIERSATAIGKVTFGRAANESLALAEATSKTTAAQLAAVAAMSDTSAAATAQSAALVNATELQALAARSAAVELGSLDEAAIAGLATRRAEATAALASAEAMAEEAAARLASTQAVLRDTQARAGNLAVKADFAAYDAEQLQSLAAEARARAINTQTLADEARSNAEARSMHEVQTDLRKRKAVAARLEARAIRESAEATALETQASKAGATAQAARLTAQRATIPIAAAQNEVTLAQNALTAANTQVEITNTAATALNTDSILANANARGASVPVIEAQTAALARNQAVANGLGVATAGAGGFFAGFGRKVGSAVKPLAAFATTGFGLIPLLSKLGPLLTNMAAGAGALVAAATPFVLLGAAVAGVAFAFYKLGNAIDKYVLTNLLGLNRETARAIEAQEKQAEIIKRISELRNYGDSGDAEEKNRSDLETRTRLLEEFAKASRDAANGSEQAAARIKEINAELAANGGEDGLVTLRAQLEALDDIINKQREATRKKGGGEIGRVEAFVNFTDGDIEKANELDLRYQKLKDSIFAYEKSMSSAAIATRQLQSAQASAVSTAVKSQAQIDAVAASTKSIYDALVDGAKDANEKARDSFTEQAATLSDNVAKLEAERQKIEDALSKKGVKPTSEITDALARIDEETAKANESLRRLYDAQAKYEKELLDERVNANREALSAIAELDIERFRAAGKFREAEERAARLRYQQSLARITATADLEDGVRQRFIEAVTRAYQAELDQIETNEKARDRAAEEELIGVREVAAAKDKSYKREAIARLRIKLEQAEALGLEREALDLRNQIVDRLEEIGDIEEANLQRAKLTTDAIRERVGLFEDQLRTISKINGTASDFGDAARNLQRDVIGSDNAVEVRGAARETFRGFDSQSEIDTTIAAFKKGLAIEAKSLLAERGQSDAEGDTDRVAEIDKELLAIREKWKIVNEEARRAADEILEAEQRLAAERKRLTEEAINELAKDRGATKVFDEADRTKATESAKQSGTIKPDETVIGTDKAGAPVVVTNTDIEAQRQAIENPPQVDETRQRELDAQQTQTGNLPPQITLPVTGGDSQELNTRLDEFQRGIETGDVSASLREAQTAMLDVVGNIQSAIADAFAGQESATAAVADAVAASGSEILSTNETVIGKLNEASVSLREVAEVTRSNRARIDKIEFNAQLTGIEGRA